MNVLMHATAVAFEGRGLLICGASGRGKSGLALELMSRGATLVADDQTALTREGAAVRMSSPEAISGLIEARGIGVLRATSAPSVLSAVLDLDIKETQRLPPLRQRVLLGCRVPLLHNCTNPYFPAALLQYLRAGRES